MTKILGQFMVQNRLSKQLLAGSLYLNVGDKSQNDSSRSILQSVANRGRKPSEQTQIGTQSQPKEALVLARVKSEAKSGTSLPPETHMLNNSSSYQAAEILVQPLPMEEVRPLDRDDARVSSINQQ